MIHRFNLILAPWNGLIAKWVLIGISFNPQTNGVTTAPTYNWWRGPLCWKVWESWGRFFGLERDETITSPVPLVPHEWQNQEKTSLMAELSCFLVNLGRLCSDGGRECLSKKGKITGFWPTCLDLLKVIWNLSIMVRHCEVHYLGRYVFLYFSNHRMEDLGYGVWW